MPNEALLNHFMAETARRFDEQNKKIEEQKNEQAVRFDRIDGKLETVLSFRFMLLGGAATVSAVVSIVLLVLFGK